MGKSTRDRHKASNSASEIVQALGSSSHVRVHHRRRIQPVSGACATAMSGKKKKSGQHRRKKERKRAGSDLKGSSLETEKAELEGAAKR